MKKIMPILITLLGITTSTYFTGCSKETEQESPKKVKQIENIQPDYIYSRAIDNIFLEKKVPLDSVKAYPEAIQNELLSDNEVGTKAALLSYAYLSGGTPFAASKMENSSISILEQVFNRKIPYKFILKLDEDLKEEAIALYKTGKSAQYINQEYKEFINIAEKGILKDDIIYKNWMIGDLIRKNVKINELNKYAELNKKYSTHITLGDAVYFEKTHVPFINIKKMAIEHYKEQKEKENEYIMNRIRE